MRSVIGHFAYDEVIGDRNKINNRLHEVIGMSIEKWGVSCTRFEVQTFKPSNRDVEKQLELQMSAERERRKQMLDTQAQVNIAEGRKQQTILLSEGDLQAQLNQAEGFKQKIILESEGLRQYAVNEGLALASQVDSISKALVSDSGASPNDDQRQHAAGIVLQLKSLAQLKAVAEGPGNSTYFFGESSGGSQGAWDIDNAERWKRSLRDGSLRQGSHGLGKSLEGAQVSSS